MALIETADGRKLRVSPSELENYELIEAISRGSKGHWAEQFARLGRDGVKRKLQILGDTGQGKAAFMGAMHGASHGLSDDAERAFFSNEGNKLEGVLDQKIARQHVASQATNPLTFGVGQVIGGALAGYGTRLGTKGVGKVLGASKADRFNQMSKLYNSGAKPPTPEQAAKLARLQRSVERIENVGFPSEKARAIGLDTMHGALAGYGGYGVAEDEGLLDPDRLARAGIGGAIGAAVAPVAAGVSSGGTNLARKMVIDRGGRVVAPGYSARLRGAPESALRTVMGQDEHLARRAMPRGTAETSLGELSPLNRGALNKPIMLANRQQMPNTAGLVDHALVSLPGGVPAPVRGLPTQQRTAMMRRIAQAPGGGQQARALASQAQDEAQEVVGRRLSGTVADASNAPPLSPREAQWVDDLTDVFRRGDFEASDAWSQAVKARLSDAGRQRLRFNIASAIKRAYDEGGTDAVLGLLDSQAVKPFLDQIGLKQLSRSLRSARDQNGLYKAVQRALDEEILPAVTRDNVKRPPAPIYAHRGDQKLARLPLISKDSAAIQGLTKPGAGRPNVVPPIDPRRSAPLLENSPVSLGQVGRRIYDEAIMPMRSGAYDYSPTTTNFAGAFSTGGVLHIDKYIHELVKMGFPPEEARTIAERMIHAEQE